MTLTVQILFTIIATLSKDEQKIGNRPIFSFLVKVPYLDHSLPFCVASLKTNQYVVTFWVQTSLSTGHPGFHGYEPLGSL